MTIRIKRLLWSPINSGWRAPSIAGEFRVIDGQWTLATRMRHYVPCRDDDTAKAAAQAHYETLIRSAIEETL